MTQPSGWYSDPDDDSQLRYFDGIVWSKHTRPKQLPDRAGETGSERTGDPSAHAPAGVTPYGHGGASGPTYPPTGHSYPPQMGQPPQHGVYPPAPPQQPYGYPGQGYPGQGYPGQGHPGQGYPQYGGYPAAGMDQSPRTGDGEVLAGWGRRLGAYILDGIIISLISGVIATLLIPGQLDVLSGWMDEIMAGDIGAEMSDQVNRAVRWVSLVTTGTWLVYEVLFLAVMSTSPGKRLLGMTVRPADAAGPLSVRHIALRTVAKLGPRFLDGVAMLSLLVMAYVLADGLWPLWDDRRQALHDKFAGTVVVRRQRTR